MHARMVRVRGGAEGRESVFERQVLPMLREQTGFSGAVLLRERDGDGGASVSYWASEDALRASAERLDAVRARVAPEAGIEIVAVEDYEIGLLERAQPAAAGTAGRIVSGTAERVDAVVEAVRDRVPQVRSLPGFRALICGIDRENGRFFIASGWDTAEQREASETVVSAFRDELQQTAGASGMETRRYELVLAEFPATARTGG